MQLDVLGVIRGSAARTVHAYTSGMQATTMAVAALESTSPLPRCRMHKSHARWVERCNRQAVTRLVNAACVYVCQVPYAALLVRGGHKSQTCARIVASDARLALVST